MGDQMNTALRRRPMFDAIVTDRKCKWEYFNSKGI
jgi:hypothetical protein